jgi:hypothetical protein
MKKPENINELVEKYPDKPWIDMILIIKND